MQTNTSTDFSIIKALSWKNLQSWRSFGVWVHIVMFGRHFGFGNLTVEDCKHLLTIQDGGIENLVYFTFRSKTNERLHCRNMLCITIQECCAGTTSKGRCWSWIPRGLFHCFNCRSISQRRKRPLDQFMQLPLFRLIIYMHDYLIFN